MKQEVYLKDRVIHIETRVLGQHGSCRSTAKLLHAHIHTDVLTEPRDTISRLLAGG